MTTTLNEPQAWITIANEVAERGLHRNLFNMTGLCVEVGGLLGSNRISHETYSDMLRRIGDHIRTEQGYGGMWFDTPGVAETRILAALFLAEESLDEHEQRVNATIDKLHRTIDEADDLGATLYDML